LHQAGALLLVAGVSERRAGYSRERWQQIRRTHNVTQVVTRTDWTLDLPLVTENGELRLYRITE
jgi:hypothetical protein